MIGRARLVGAVVSGAALVTVAAVSWAGTETPPPTDLPEPAAEQAVEAVEQGRPPEDAGRPEGAGPPGQSKKADKADTSQREGQSVEPIACDEARNHGEYVSSIARSTPSGPGKGAIVSAAARSDCGKPASD